MTSAQPMLIAEELWKLRPDCRVILAEEPADRARSLEPASLGARRPPKRKVPAAADREPWATCSARDATCLPFGVVGELRRKPGRIATVGGDGQFREMNSDGHCQFCTGATDTTTNGQSLLVGLATPKWSTFFSVFSSVFLARRVGLDR